MLTSILWWCILNDIFCLNIRCGIWIPALKLYELKMGFRSNCTKQKNAPFWMVLHLLAHVSDFSQQCNHILSVIRSADKGADPLIDTASCSGHWEGPFFGRSKQDLRSWDSSASTVTVWQNGGAGKLGSSPRNGTDSRPSHIVWNSVSPTFFFRTGHPVMITVH